MVSRQLIIACFLVALAPGLVAAESPVAELRVFPADVKLVNSQSRQLIVVQAVYADGLTRDVTAEATWNFTDGSKVRRDGNTLWPAADGQSEMSVSFAGITKSIPVSVEKAAELRPISFKRDVMPIFMKAGCNSGSCHGAARGKDGFRISLFGFDPDGDHHRITRELSGRRIDLSVPEASLLFEKAVGAVPHTGGKRFEPDSELARELKRWIESNVPNDPDLPLCTSIEIDPPQAVLDGEGATQQVVVRARYSDGSVRDVTSLALFLSNNETSAAINQSGLVKAGTRGEAFVMARFATHTVGSQFIVLPKGLQYAEQPFEPTNYVDELVAAKLKKLRLHPSGTCSDEEFLRRIYIDLVGILPTADEYTAFMADADPQKRTKKIDELLGRKEFTELWVSKWAEWLMMRSTNTVSYKSVVLYYNWLKDQIASNVPLDKMVQNLLSANGGTFAVPQTNFYQIETDSLKVSENVAQIFMGMRIQCAQCHNHPFDRWTQNDYYNFSAFFSQIGRKGAEDYRELVIFNSGGGEVTHPVTGQPAVPHFLGGGKADVAGKDRRAVMAQWLASPQNPYFASNFVNRIWQHFFGIGIVEPVDDVRVSNPASNPELLAELAKRFTESNYDFKKLVREICMSKAYQRSTQRNESNLLDEKNFAHQTIRRIKAESMLDIVSQVTNTKDKFRGLPLGARAVQISDGQTSDYFLMTFGRATRGTPCSCEVKMEPTLSQALHLMNGDTVNSKIRAGGVLAALKQKGLDPAQTIEHLYISCLARKPTDEEKAALLPLVADPATLDQALEDIFWALINSREILFNH